MLGLKAASHAPRTNLKENNISHVGNVMWQLDLVAGHKAINPEKKPDSWILRYQKLMSRWSPFYKTIHLQGYAAPSSCPWTFLAHCAAFRWILTKIKHLGPKLQLIREPQNNENKKPCINCVCRLQKNKTKPIKSSSKILPHSSAVASGDRSHIDHNGGLYTLY